MIRSAILLSSSPTQGAIDRGNPLSIAPMMDRTDRHFRYFMRQITRRTLLYTEMITTGAVIHGDRAKLLGFSPQEKPISLQLGGDNPTELAECARIAESMGYDEVNLNLGCPSDRVQSGNFGACLMLQPDRVAQAIEAMQRVVSIPVTVKHRIGVDDHDRYEDMVTFVRTIAEAGCQRFTVHARKAWLEGLSPKENRTVPPLRYEDVYQLKRDFPDLFIELNGGIQSLEAARDHLQHVDAAMIGRAAYDNPYLLADADRLIYGDEREPRSRAEVVENMMGYCDRWMAQGFKLGSITRHMLQLFAGQPGTKAWKRYLSEHVYVPGVDATVLEKALAQVNTGSP
jgi:tRNA-dihydrouridine synthase A